MSVFLTQRSSRLEYLDTEVIDEHSFAFILRHLENINLWLGGVHATLSHLKRFSKTWKPGETIRILDWGTGGADLPRAIIRWGRKHGYSLEIVGVDSNATALDYARKACREYPEIQLEHSVIPAEAGIQSWTPAFAGGTNHSFDYVLSSLCLHHLSDEQIVGLLKKSDGLSTRGIIMNDLKRSARAWLWIWGLSRLFRAHPIVQHDGPLSVLRGFTKRDLESYAKAANLSYLRVHTHFGYRYILAGEK